MKHFSIDVQSIEIFDYLTHIWNGCDRLTCPNLSQNHDRQN